MSDGTDDSNRMAQRERLLVIQQRLTVLTGLVEEIETLLARELAETVVQAPQVKEALRAAITADPAVMAGRADGWWTGPVSYQERTGVRLKNPLCLKGPEWRGSVGTDTRGHARFEDAAYGVRAAMKNLSTYWVLHKLRTVADIIGRWAPATDTQGSLPGRPANDPGAYAAAVAKALRRGVRERLDLFTDNGSVKDGEQLMGLVQAMAEYEVGAGFRLTRDVLERALRLL